jgi:hypothetical protein
MACPRLPRQAGQAVRHESTRVWKRVLRITGGTSTTGYPAPNHRLQPTPSSVRCAPAFRRPRPLTGHTDSPYNGLHMHNGVRSTWPALLSGTREGGKPRDKSAATLSHGRVDRPDLLPLLTQATCANRPCKRTGASGCYTCPTMGGCRVPTGRLCRDVVPQAPGRQQAAQGRARRRMAWHWGTPLPPSLGRGRANASVWAGGRRQRRSHMPGGHVVDRVKDCQAGEKARRPGPWSSRGHRRGLCP